MRLGIGVRFMAGRHSASKQLAQRNALEARIANNKYEEAVRRASALRQASQYSMAQSVRLRSYLQLIEGAMPDAAPAAAAMVRMAEGAMLAALLEFDAGL